MANKIIPIKDLVYPDYFPSEVADIFEDEEDASQDDQFTYTIRYTVEDEKIRDRIREKVRERLDDEEAERLIKLMDDNDWDVSFLIDCY